MRMNGTYRPRAQRPEGVGALVHHIVVGSGRSSGSGWMMYGLCAADVRRGLHVVVVRVFVADEDEIGRDAVGGDVVADLRVGRVNEDVACRPAS